MAKTKSNLKILVANGVNLDLLGQRQVSIYGTESLKDIEKKLMVATSKDMAHLFPQVKVELEFFQSNHEGAFLDKLSKKYDGFLMNPGAWTHTSIALADRLAGLETPFVEVHLSNLARREDFRQRSFTAPHASGIVQGFGGDSYYLGLLALVRRLVGHQN